VTSLEKSQLPERLGFVRSRVHSTYCVIGAQEAATISTMDYNLPLAIDDRLGVAGGQLQLTEPVPEGMSCRVGPQL
jgi:hypothetical protein